MAEIKNSQKFKTVTTNLGRNAVALAHGSGSSVRLTHMAVGDGKGKEIEPIATMTELVHEVHRGAINDIIILEDKPGEFIAELLIPQNIGGFFIREVGLFLEDGTLFAIGSTPLTEKTEISSGAASDLLVRMIIRIIDSGVIEIVIDPTQVLATRDYVDRSIQKGIDNHNKDENAHKHLFDAIKEQISSGSTAISTHITDPNAHSSLFEALRKEIEDIPQIELSDSLELDNSTIAGSAKAINTLFKLIKGENVPEFPDISGGGGKLKQIGARASVGKFSMNVEPYKPIICSIYSPTNLSAGVYMYLVSGFESINDTANCLSWIGAQHGFLKHFVLLPIANVVTIGFWAGELRLGSNWGNSEVRFYQ